MTTYTDAATALVNAGYLRNADVDAAAKVLEDAQAAIYANDMQSTAYANAAEALLVAGLIDGGDLKAVAGVLSDDWVVEFD